MRRSTDVKYKPAPAAKQATSNHLQFSEKPAYEFTHKESMLGTGRISLHNDLRRGLSPRKAIAT
jgi:hypothetical protein